MKKVFLGFVSAAFLFGCMTVFSQNAAAQEKAGLKTGKKVLVVYYSYSGNTRQMAQYIQKASGGDIFEIQTVDAYPSEYNALINQAKEEINADYKPKIKGGVADIGKYDIIFIGSPSWWATIAPAVATFLSQHDLSGKTVVPFVTHEGTGMGKNAQDIAKLAPKAVMVEGKAFRGGSVKNAEKQAEEWVQSILK